MTGAETAETAEADRFLGYPHLAQRQDLRGAANLARIVSYYAPNLTQPIRLEIEQIASRLTQIAMGGK